MKTVAFVLALSWTQLPALFAQHMPMMPVVKLGKLVPGDTLDVMIFKKPDQAADASINVHLHIGVLDDGTIAVPLLLERAPAAGLSISQLNSELRQRYTSYFQHFGPSPTFTPPQVVVGFLGHLGKTALDNLISRLGKPPTAR